MHSSIAILDFGSQYAQLIARRVREAQVYCELFPWDTPPEKVLAINPKGFILSGGPASVYAAGAPSLLPYILESKLPILGLCYGMQLLAHTLGGEGGMGIRDQLIWQSGNQGIRKEPAMENTRRNSRRINTRQEQLCHHP